MPIYTSGPQPYQDQEVNSTGLGTAGIAAAGVVGFGFSKYKGERLWDKYVRSIRAVETGFPAAILRTFRLSEALSPLEDYSKISVGAKELQSGSYARFIKNTFNPSGGISLTRTGHVFGKVTDDSDKLIGYGLQIKAGHQSGAGIGDYYARLTGTKLGLKQSLNTDLLKSQWKAAKVDVPFKDWKETLPEAHRYQRLIVGRQIKSSLNLLGFNVQLSQDMAKKVTKAKVVTDFARAKAATSIGRLNMLLADPVGVPVVGKALAKVPGISKMAVKPGSASSMLARYAGKGLAIAGAWKGLEYLDYLRHDNKFAYTGVATGAGYGIGRYLFGSGKAGLAGAGIGLLTGLMPRFNEGLFYGAASVPADLNIARSRVTETLGINDTLRQQQEVTPDLISGKTALGFAGVGAVAVGLGGYGKFLQKSLSQRGDEALFETFDKVRKETSESLGERVWGSRIGKKVTSAPGLGKLSKIKSPIGIGAIAGLALWQGLVSSTSLLSGSLSTAVPGVGLLGTEETPEELEAIYSGEQEVPVRKGRWWTFGRSEFEGEHIQYFRPHFLARLKDRLYQKGIWEDEEEKWAHDPWLNPIKALFGSDDWKYHYEIKHQYDRPAPMTSTYGEDIPFIGPLVAATFGQLFKPRKLVRPEEWHYGDDKFGHLPSVKEEENPSYALGGLGPGSPVSPDDPKQMLNKLTYERREATGLVGFLGSVISKNVLGREEPFPHMTEIETMGKETGSEYWFWKHLNLGDPGGLTEVTRRFIPTTPSHWDQYNPLSNTMPSWLPDDFKHGNPFSKVPEAEFRLPGAGFEARYPELKGTDPEKYPLPYKAKILCLDEDTIIHTKKGITKIKEISTDDEVFSEDGCFHKIIHKQMSKDIKNTYSIKTYYQHRPLICSEKHKILTADKEGNILEKTAEEITDKDYLVFSKAQFQNNKQICVGDFLNTENCKISYKDKSFYIRHKYSHMDIPFYLEANYELGFIFGLYLAKGWAGKNKITWTLHIKEKDTLVKRVEDFIYSIGLNPSTREKEKNNCCQISTNSEILSKLLKSMLGEGSANKEIKFDWTLYSKEFVQGIFDGHFNGDGYFAKTGNNIVARSTSISENLLMQLRLIGFSLDIVSGVNQRKRVSKSNENSILQESFYLDIQRRDTYKINCYKQHIYDKCKYKASKSKKFSFSDDEHVFVRVKEIKNINQKNNWYDLTLDGINNVCRFITQVGIVHNSDVAMWSDEYRQTMSQARRNFDQYTPEQQKIIADAERQVAEKKKRKDFDEYRFSENLLRSRRAKIQKVIDPKHVVTDEFGGAVVDLQGVGFIKDQETAMKIAKESLLGKSVDLHISNLDSAAFYQGSQGPAVKAVATVGDQEYGNILASAGAAEYQPLKDEFAAVRMSTGQRLAGSISEKFMHGIETPLEYLTPVSPASKLISHRSALEEYVATEAVGTKASFWDRPVENFLEPAANMAKYSVSGKIPAKEIQKRNIEEYFDMLKWVKYSRLENQAKSQNRFDLMSSYRKEKHETVFGANVFGNSTSLFRALPYSDRDFFEAFTDAKTEQQRQEILEVVPEAQQRAYLSTWLRKDAEAAKAKIAANIATKQDVEIVHEYNNARKSDGIPYTPDLEQQWKEETGGQVPFDEWLRELKAHQYFSTHSLPGADWIGFNPAVDLEDIKMVYVETAGFDYHDFGLWDARKRSLARKPYIDQESVEALQSAQSLEEGDISPILSLPGMYGNKDFDFTVGKIEGNIDNSYNVTIKDGRSDLINSAKNFLGVS